MACLLDTNVLIWLYRNDPRLSRNALERIESGEEPLFVSVVSAWEYSQKRRKRPDELRHRFDEVIAGLPHEKLDLTFDIHSYAESLPPIHSDPFDRMLIAQALHHDLTLIASDETIQRYPVRWLW